MKKLPVLAAGVILLFAAVSAFAQDEQSGMIKTADGVLVVWNEPGNYFTIEIKGQRIEPAERPMMFAVDGKFFQVVTTEKAQFAKGGKSDDRSILEAHRQWEADYISEMLGGRKLDIKSSWVKTAAGADALRWSYDAPKVDDRQTALRQLYLTTVKRNHVLVLNTVVEPGGDETKLWQLLTDTLNTLKPSDKPLSLKAVSEQVKKGP